MTEPNRLLRAARERLPSPAAPGEHASRAEIADAVNAWLWETTGKRHALDAHYLAKLERGVARWPNAAYRSALRHVLGVPDDQALGFTPPRRADASPLDQSGPPALGWDPAAVVDHAQLMTERDLTTHTRRHVLTGAALLAGTALAAELQPFLFPPAPGAGRTGVTFTGDELDATEQFVGVLRSWSTKHTVISWPTVVAQLNAHASRLRAAPQDRPETLRGFRIGAELADITATMAWDTARHADAQRYFILAAKLAHAAHDDGLAAVALSSLARQCFDLGRSTEGLDVVQLAQYGTRRTATPRLRAVLATREAWAHALLGDTRAFHRAVGLAEDYFTEGTTELDARTPSTRSLDEAELAGTIGARYRDLARFDARHAGTAQKYLARALDLRAPERVRNRVFDTISLARSHLISREPDRAGELITAVLPVAAQWASGRVGAKLQDFRRESASFATVPAVRDAREAIADLTAA
ncbi:hypothetical protein AB0878_46285 [Amycolatopsis sp. NPDC047767]|uniref:hypothetical protein n=1 Tax=Amycolatopsis sp. NPDC047767 TaxID=3156765 RepID=UPI0034525942